MKQLTLLLSLTCISLFALAQPGTLDAPFGGGDGLATMSFDADWHANPQAVAVQADGRILVAGGTWEPMSNEKEAMALARFMPNGSPDPTFGGPAGRITITLPDYSASISDVVFQPDGKFVVAGGAWTATDEDHLLIGRFNANGTPDTGFGPNGTGFLTPKLGITYEYLFALALQSDGKILVGGYANFNGYEDMVVLRYKANGTPDNTFGGGDGIVSIPMGESYSGIRSMLVQPDGKILLAGYAVDNGQEDVAVLRLKPNGDMDNTFSGDGKWQQTITNTTDRINKVLLQPDGRILLAGYSGEVANALKQMLLLRLTANGTPDNTFGGGDGISRLSLGGDVDICYEAVLQPDGKVLLGGASRLEATQPYRFSVARVDVLGNLDATFGNGDGWSAWALTSNSCFGHAAALQPDGKMLLAGRIYLGEFSDFGLIRVVTGASVDTTQPETPLQGAMFYPNPVVDEATIRYTLSTPETIEIALYDAEGRFIAQLLTPTAKTAGEHIENINIGAALPAGQYTIRLTSNQQVTAMKMAH